MSTPFTPDYAAPPGDMLAETLEHLGMSQTELARRMGRPIKTINEIIQAKTALTADTALELERVLGIPAHLWTNMEASYREHLARQRAADTLEVDEGWLASLPVKQMEKRGWIPAGLKGGPLMEQMLRFFGTHGKEEFTAVWQERLVAFRKSPAFQGSPEAMAAWIRQAELEGRAQRCEMFDAATFEKTLPEIKSISLKEPKLWVAAIREACNACGVAYVFLPEIEKIHVSGATFWLNETCALIVQSGRHKDDGHFWFTFFHEARHVLQGKQKKEWRIEGIGIEDALERDADLFAGEFLVPVARLKALRAQHAGKMPVTAVKGLAAELGVAPGIIAGSLMHVKVWHPTVANKLLRRFTVEEMLPGQ